VFFTSAYSPTTLQRFRPAGDGKYRFRVSAYGFQTTEPVTMSVYAGTMQEKDQKSHLVGYYDIPAKEPRVVEFTETLKRDQTIKIVPYGLAANLASKADKKIAAATYEGPGLAIQWIEVEGPLQDNGPPESYRRLFGTLEPDKGELADAERILAVFMPRAYRRPVAKEELQACVDLVGACLKQGQSFSQALRMGLQAVLCSHHFLFFKEEPGKLDEFALASRLSYFLWSSMPDEPLFELARQGKLHEPETLRQQVERMLEDPRAKRFSEDFVGQWLDLRQIEFTTPDKRLYRNFDELLQVSMVQETLLFFEEILKNDLSVLNFVDSDFTFLNEPLAEHYGIRGVKGREKLRKVKLPPGCHRGGVLTQASVLKVTANGTSTSPVQRGVWVLRKVMGQPPPPPPKDVPALEPDIRGATTMREQLAKHRQIASCAGCHAQIDPIGFALENFDVIGSWREFYRVVDPVVVDGQVRGMRSRKGPAVDAADTLPDGRSFSDIDEFKRLLGQDKDQVARALAEHLLTYATGGSVRAADRPAIDEIVARVRPKNYGLRTLIHEIVQSPTFQSK